MLCSWHWCHSRTVCCVYSTDLTVEQCVMLRLKFSTVGLCVYWNSEQLFITKLYNYLFIVPTRLKCLALHRQRSCCGSTLVDIHFTKCYGCSVSELVIKTDSRFVSCECPVCVFRCFHPIFCGTDVRWLQKKPSDFKISWCGFSIWWDYCHINNTVMFLSFYLCIGVFCGGSFSYEL